MEIKEVSFTHTHKKKTTKNTFGGCNKTRNATKREVYWKMKVR